MLTESAKLLAMEEKERIVGLTDSSGSDGSLSKDLSKRAELNFSAPSLPLEDDQIDTGGDLEVVEENSHDESTNRGENKVSFLFLQVFWFLKRHMQKLFFRI